MWEEVQQEAAESAAQAPSLSQTQKTLGSQMVTSSQDETPFPGWDPSPERPPRSSGVSSNYSHTTILTDIAEDVYRRVLELIGIDAVHPRDQCRESSQFKSQI